jgi:hypothetical protein
MRRHRTHVDAYQISAWQYMRAHHQYKNTRSMLNVGCHLWKSKQHKLQNTATTLCDDTPSKEGTAIRRGPPARVSRCWRICFCLHMLPTRVSDPSRLDRKLGPCKGVTAVRRGVPRARVAMPATASLPHASQRGEGIRPHQAKGLGHAQRTWRFATTLPRAIRCAGHPNRHRRR